MNDLIAAGNRLLELMGHLIPSCESHDMLAGRLQRAVEFSAELSSSPQS